MMIKLALTIYIVGLSTIYSQNPERNLVDENYDVLSKMIRTSKKDTILQGTYLAAYLKKAQLEGNWEQIVEGYKKYLHNRPVDQRMEYADSMVSIASRSKDKLLMSSAFLTKGAVYYGEKVYEKAMEHCVIANNYLLKSEEKSEYLKYKILYMIGQVNYCLEKFDMALSNLNSCLDYFETHNSRAYLNTIHSIGLCHRSRDDFGKCSKTNQLGITKGKELGDTSVEVYFKHSEGINQFYKGNYFASIDILQKAIPSIEKLKDFGNVILSHYYLGKNYWALGKSEDAIPHLIKVDQSFVNKGYIKLEFIDTFKILMKYYKSIGRRDKYQYYSQNLHRADSTLLARNNKLTSQLSEGYKLANHTYEMNQVNDQNNRNKIILFLFLILASILVFYLIRNRNYYKGVYERIISSRAKSRKSTEAHDKSLAPIIKQLQGFEVNKEYLDNQLSLTKLASSFGTNTSYLSSAIRQEKDMTYANYINSLRVSHAIELMEGYKSFEKVTIRKLSKKAGFNSIERFRKTFKAIKGMPPSEYIKELENNNSKKA